MHTVIIDGDHLTIEDIIAVARHGAKVKLASSARNAMEKSRSWVEDIISRGDPVYGINTGFGVFSEQSISSENCTQLSRNLILSHAVGTGEPLAEEIVRAAMLIRANTLAKGHSGIRVVVVEKLLALLNKNVTPFIPGQGSLGSSGDLAQLSHLALVFTTDKLDYESESGKAHYQGEVLSGKAALELAGIDRIVLEAKEGLALSNGSTFTAAICALAVNDAAVLLRTGEVALAMSLEALLGCSAAFDERLHQVRGFSGQMRVAEAVRTLTKGSELLDLSDCVQDAYALRCAPQVQGFCWETLNFVKGVIITEINAATDNPLLFEPGIALSGGNFHGEPLGMAMDFLAIALAELAAISERRTNRLIDGHLSRGLPPMLVEDEKQAGLNSGLMMPHYAAVSLVLENRTLASPDSVQSLPTSAQQEDHNANSMTSARHTREIITNTAHVLAIEVYTAARALDLRLHEYPDAILGEGTALAHRKIRAVVAYQAGDALWGPEIDLVRKMILKKELEIPLPA